MYTDSENIDNELYRELFSSVIYIVREIKKGGLVYGIDEDRIITKFEGSKKLLLLMIKLSRRGYSDPTFCFYMDLEFEKLLKNISDEIELTELVLAKELTKHVQKFDPDAIYELISHVGTWVLRNELVPKVNWVDSE